MGLHLKPIPSSIHVSVFTHANVTCYLGKLKVQPLPLSETSYSNTESLYSLAVKFIITVLLFADFMGIVLFPSLLSSRGCILCSGAELIRYQQLWSVLSL